MRLSHSALARRPLPALPFRLSLRLAPFRLRALDVSIVAYNVKSLFDATDDGPEFPEFSVAKGKWDDARYKIRLANVAAAVLAAGPSRRRPPDPTPLPRGDRERESAGSPPRGSARPPPATATPRSRPPEGGPFSICALSRLPILSAVCHAASTPAGRAGRDVLELELDAGGRRLVLLACHWKSKSGGAEETEEARREDAALVRGRVAARMAADPGVELVVCGDFNESPDEFLRVNRRYATALMPVEEACDKRPRRPTVSSSRSSALSRHGSTSGRDRPL